MHGSEGYTPCPRPARQSQVLVSYSTNKYWKQRKWSKHERGESVMQIRHQQMAIYENITGTRRQSWSWFIPFVCKSNTFLFWQNVIEICVVKSASFHPPASLLQPFPSGNTETLTKWKRQWYFTRPGTTLILLLTHIVLIMEKHVKVERRAK